MISELRTHAATLQTEIERAVQAADELKRAEAARKARGLLHRLRHALRGD